MTNKKLIIAPASTKRLYVDLLVSEKTENGSWTSLTSLEHAEIPLTEIFIFTF